MNNAILAQEVLNHISHSKTKEGSIVIKIDLEKAYDHINWNFLEDMFNLFGIPRRMIGLIMWGGCSRI